MEILEHADDWWWTCKLNGTTTSTCANLRSLALRICGNWPETLCNVVLFIDFFLGEVGKVFSSFVEIVVPDAQPKTKSI